MNRNHLALFQAVAQAGSISAAATAVRVSQPAVSRQIAELEDELGIRLLDRHPRGCRLTEAGGILAAYASRWQSVEKDAARAIEEFRGLKRGRLTVGASLTIGGYLLPGMLSEFHCRYPEIELQVEIGNTEHVHRALLAGTIELGLTEGTLDAEELESTVFFQDELVAIAPPNHPLMRKGAVSAARSAMSRFSFERRALVPGPSSRGLCVGRGSPFDPSSRSRALRLSRTLLLKAWEWRLCRG